MTEKDELVEAAAKAIYLHWQNAPGPHVIEWEKRAERCKQDFSDKARAAIASIRPTIVEEVLREVLMTLSLDNPVNPQRAMKREMESFLRAYASQRGIAL